jgi:peptidoglycan hydrolase-like amidase
VVYNGDKKMGTLPKKKVAILKYVGGVYSVKGGGFNFRTNNHIRIEPAHNKRAVFTLLNFERSMSRVGPGEFNKYRGAFEYRIGEKDGLKYIVNETLLSDYSAGIAETGKRDAIEFVKANVVAARTYAYISIGKYPFFDVLGNTYDQLFLGYKNEEFMPDVLAAAQATRGMIVTYNGEAVTTPYFGNSSGTTRAWHTVWGGKKKPWLVPVHAEYDAGRRQFGHGVGMSQRDAQLRAKDQGASWQELLKHYYTGISIELFYE